MAERVRVWVDWDTSGRQEAVRHRDWPPQSLCVGCKAGAGAPFVRKEVKYQRYTQRRLANRAETRYHDTVVCRRFSGAGQEI